MSGAEKPSSPPSGRELATRDREFLDRALALEEGRLRLRAKEIEIEGRDGENAHKFGVESLKLQADDLKHDREARRDRLRIRLRAVLIVAAIVAGLIVTAMLKDKDAVAMEIVKALIAVAGGFGAGYAAGRSGPKKSDSTSGQGPG